MTVWLLCASFTLWLLCYFGLWLLCATLTLWLLCYFGSLTTSCYFDCLATLCYFGVGAFPAFWCFGRPGPEEVAKSHDWAHSPAFFLVAQVITTSCLCYIVLSKSCWCYKLLLKDACVTYRHYELLLLVPSESFQCYTVASTSSFWYSFPPHGKFRYGWYSWSVPTNNNRWKYWVTAASRPDLWVRSHYECPPQLLQCLHVLHYWL